MSQLQVAPLSESRIKTGSCHSEHTHPTLLGASGLRLGLDLPRQAVCAYSSLTAEPDSVQPSRNFEAKPQRKASPVAFRSSLQSLRVHNGEESLETKKMQAAARVAARAAARAAGATRGARAAARAAGRAAGSAGAPKSEREDIPLSAFAA